MRSRQEGDTHRYVEYDDYDYSTRSYAGFYSSNIPNGHTYDSSTEIDSSFLKNVGIVCCGIYWIVWVVTELNYRSKTKQFLEYKNDTTTVEPNDKFPGQKKYVFIQGNLLVADSPFDSEFNLKTSGCIALFRSVETFQWVEGRVQTQNNRTEITYTSKWGSYIDSSNFRDQRYQNTKPAYSDKSFIASNVTIGNWQIDAKCLVEHVEKTDIEGTASKYIYSQGSNTANPRIGDTRTSWKVV
jgi:hypothetical protein